MKNCNTYVLYFPKFKLWKVGSTTNPVQRFTTLRREFQVDELRLDGFYGYCELKFHGAFGGYSSYVGTDYGFKLAKVKKPTRIPVKYARSYKKSIEFYDFHNKHPKYAIKVVRDCYEHYWTREGWLTDSEDPVWGKHYNLRKARLLNELSEFDKCAFDKTLLPLMPWLSLRRQ